MNIYAMTLNEIEMYLANTGENVSKAKIISKALYRERIEDFSQIPEIRKDIKNKLFINFKMSLPKIIEISKTDFASKFLFILEDDNIIESVLMNQKYGFSLCISTQVGCNMGCKFCQSGRFKKVRNLETHEMVGQILKIEKELCIKVSNVVLMGIGEPFDNNENVIDFLSILSDPYMYGLGKNHYCISSCGIVPRIYEFADSPFFGLLAISLHAPNDNIRNKIMPINASYPINELMDAIDYYIAKTNKKVFLEYIMLKNINDSEQNAIELSNLIGKRKCHVNLIPYNETLCTEFESSTNETIMTFFDALKKNNICVTIRREFGSDLNAACGQLRSDYIKKK